MRYVTCVFAIMLCVGCADAPAPSVQSSPPPKKAVDDAAEIQSRMLAELQEQNRLLRQQQQAKEAESAWESEREKLFQSWSRLGAKRQEELDKATFDFKQNVAEAKSRMNPGTIHFRPQWVPTYNERYPQFLEEYRKLCGKMSKQELQQFARQQSLPWVD